MYFTHRHTQMMMACYVLITLSFASWSWVMVDPNFTLVGHHSWSVLREWAVSVGRFDPALSTQWYITTGVLLWLVHLLFLWKLPKVRHLMRWALVIGLIAGLLSYPAISHDLFNYIFDAKILTRYHQNPYYLRAMDFPLDPDLRFMRWIHRVYPYGPVFLLLSLVPSTLSMGKFLLAFLFFKMGYVAVYVSCIWYIRRIDEKAALVFMTSPLVIIEGLMNSHNDLIGVWLGIMGFYYIGKKKLWVALVLMIASGLVKYFTLPLVIVPLGLLIALRMKQNWMILSEEALTCSACVAMCGLIGYAWYSSTELYAWYFLNIFVFVPYLVRLGRMMCVSILGMILCYYPYVSGGGWERAAESTPRKMIMLYGLIVNIVCLGVWYVWKKVIARSDDWPP